MGLTIMIDKVLNYLSFDSPLTLVSVITPVYNGAEFLEECIESVLKQTYSNWVYTIVDNASTDATPEIIEHYVKKDSRIIHVRFEDFVEAIENHNRALGYIDRRSGWCKVVLADDWLYPECLERMLALAGRSPSLGIISSFQRWGDVIVLEGLPYHEEVFDGREVLAWCLRNGTNLTGTPTGPLLRTDLVLARDQFYDRDIEAADTDAVFRSLVDVDFGFVHQVLTYARRQGGTRIDRALRIRTQIAENVLFVIRYGRAAFDPATYRSTLRGHLRTYVFSQVKNTARLSRLVDREFFDFHRHAIEVLRREGGHDREVVWATRIIRLLLARRVLGSGLRSLQRKLG
jgi:glycosyltransferase involved in cell wall biosynthesis